MDELEAEATVPDEAMDIDGGENALCTLNDTDHYRVDAPMEEDFDVSMHDWQPPCRGLHSLPEN